MAPKVTWQRAILKNQRVSSLFFPYVHFHTCHSSVTIYDVGHWPLTGGQGWFCSVRRFWGQLCVKNAAGCSGWYMERLGSVCRQTAPWLRSPSHRWPKHVEKTLYQKTHREEDKHGIARLHKAIVYHSMEDQAPDYCAKAPHKFLNLSGAIRSVGNILDHQQAAPANLSRTLLNNTKQWIGPKLQTAVAVHDRFLTLTTVNDPWVKYFYILTTISHS